MKLEYNDKFGDDRHQVQNGLYIIPTPIGNLRDITLRAIDILGSADIVACEDTRVAKHLLETYDLHPKLIAYHDYNAAKQRPRLLKKLEEGNVVCLISDAGTPLIADPGYKLVQAATKAGSYVTALPGASAVLSGVLASGLPVDRFLFAGFPPPRKSARRRFLKEFEFCPTTLVFFESANRLSGSIYDMFETFGNRQAAIVRELTKKFEELKRDTLSGLSTELGGSPPPKGEIVVVVGPPARKIASETEIDEALCIELKEASVKEAASKVSHALGVSRRLVYRRALDLKR